MTWFVLPAVNVAEAGSDASSGSVSTVQASSENPSASTRTSAGSASWYTATTSDERSVGRTSGPERTGPPTPAGRTCTRKHGAVTASSQVTVTWR